MCNRMQWMCRHHLVQFSGGGKLHDKNYVDTASENPQLNVNSYLWASNAFLFICWLVWKRTLKATMVSNNRDGTHEVMPKHHWLLKGARSILKNLPALLHKQSRMVEEGLYLLLSPSAAKCTSCHYLFSRGIFSMIVNVRWNLSKNVKMCAERSVHIRIMRPRAYFVPRMGKVKSAFEKSGPSGRRLSRFL